MIHDYIDSNSLLTQCLTFTHSYLFCQLVQMNWWWRPQRCPLFIDGWLSITLSRDVSSLMKYWRVSHQQSTLTNQSVSNLKVRNKNWCKPFKKIYYMSLISENKYQLNYSSCVMGICLVKQFVFNFILIGPPRFTHRGRKLL